MTTADRSFRVRPAAVADLPAMVDLIEVVAAEGRWIGTEHVDRPQRHDHLLASLSSPQDCDLVAEAAGRLVGQIGMRLRPFGVADVGMLVAAPWRRRGVGTALLGAGIDWARDAGAHKVALQVWPHNEGALALYRRFGFVDEGLLRRHYRRRNGEVWDAVVMGLPLDEALPPAGT